ncbi:MAG: 2Fe-2S iron-sulfur cluster-binding protein, partial [Planctomycetota bacterium]
MKSHIVVFLPDGACVEVEPGRTILEAADAAGVAVDSACGGQGACGKCRVLVTLGQTGGE